MNIHLKDQHILVTGGSGFVGQHLVPVLVGCGARVYVVQHSSPLKFSPTVSSACVFLKNPKDYEALKGIQLNAIVHLAGAGIGDKPWTTGRRALLRSSRIDSLQKLVKTLTDHDVEIKHILAASAIGYYGNQSASGALLDESSPPGNGFGSELCQAVESNLEALARQKNAYWTALRIGVVLGKDGGFMQRLLPLYKKRLGAVFGDGKQWFSWVAIYDLVHSIAFILSQDQPREVVNIVSPHPVTAQEFADTMGKQLQKPVWLKIPRLCVKFMGELSSLFLDSTKVQPKKLLNQGYIFKFSRIDQALTEIIQP